MGTKILYRRDNIYSKIHIDDQLCTSASTISSMTLSKAGNSRGMNGATSAGSLTRRHILSMTLAAFLLSTDERPRSALPSRGAIRANVGESTVIR